MRTLVFWLVLLSGCTQRGHEPHGAEPARDTSQATATEQEGISRYVFVTGDTLTFTIPPNAPPFPLQGLPDFALPVAMADTIVLLLMGDSAITLRPVSGVPLSSETVKGILNLVKMGDRLLAKP